MKNKKLNNSQRLFPELERVVEELLLEKGIDSARKKTKFLFPDFDQDIFDPFLLSDMEKAVGRVLLAVKKQEKVCVYGDYDVDGVTGTAILLDFLLKIGANVFSYIPHRQQEGYGMNKEAIKKIHQKRADLIITVDCGISNVSEVEEAKKLGIEVIILDHHNVPVTLPRAFAVVNPKKKGENYPEKELAGVGVAFKFIQALSSKISDYNQELNKWLLDLVAIGTIGDCVSLLGENRVLAKFGLLVLSKTKRIGLKQLFNVARINIDDSCLPNSWQISFQLAPRINAAGRVGHADLALRLLMAETENVLEARKLAEEIEKKNYLRQKTTEQILKEIEFRLSENSLPNAIIESAPNWNIGLVGLVAGKIAEKYNRPTIIFQEKEGILKGSGRSIEGIDLMKVLEKNKNLFCKFGGHSQAVGLELKKERLEDFFKLTNNFFEKINFNSLKEKKKRIEINFSEITDKLLRELSFFEPFGIGNEKPYFYCQNLEIVEKRLVGNGEKHLKVLLKEKNNSTVFEAIGFGMGKIFSRLSLTKKVAAVFEITKDNWNGREKIQLRLEDLIV